MLDLLHVSGDLILSFTLSCMNKRDQPVIRTDPLLPFLISFLNQP